MIRLFSDPQLATVQAHEKVATLFVLLERCRLRDRLSGVQAASLDAASADFWKTDFLRASDFIYNFTRDHYRDFADPQFGHRFVDRFVGDLQTVLDDIVLQADVRPPMSTFIACVSILHTVRVLLKDMKSIRMTPDNREPAVRLADAVVQLLQSYFPGRIHLDDFSLEPDPAEIVRGFQDFSAEFC